MALDPSSPADDPLKFLAARPTPRDSEGAQLDALFRKASGFEPELWPGNIIGYGRYDYIYDSGRSGTSLATGFSPRKAAISIYIMPGYADYDSILSRLGPYKMGKSCLYVTRLARIDMEVLSELVTTGLADLKDKWPVRP